MLGEQFTNGCKSLDARCQAEHDDWERRRQQTEVGSAANLATAASLEEHAKAARQDVAVRMRDKADEALAKKKARRSIVL